MTSSLRSYWRNCTLQADVEILAIDRMEDQIAPLTENVLKIRNLISSLELCHHKAQRWVDNIIAAIAEEQTTKGLGTRSPGQQHPAEKIWLNTCAILSSWLSHTPCSSNDLNAGNVPASQIIAHLGERSALKEWQVQRVVEKIRSSIHWPQSLNDPSAQYVWILLNGDEYESAYLKQCPQAYKEHEDFWLNTVRTFIHDTEDGNNAELSLGLAIDMLWPCHWNFIENLQIVLAAIGGNLNPKKPFAACGRNITPLPVQHRMDIITHTLQVFCGVSKSNQEIDNSLLARLGEATKVKQWLAASLHKTISLQLKPPAELRAISALNGPDWIRQ